MFVKIYQYHIQKDKMDEYLMIQGKTLEIYSRYLDFHTMYLQSKNDETKWMEITKYKNEEEYHKGIKLINEQEEILELFEAFQSLLVSDKKAIIEENYLEKKQEYTF